MKGYPYSFGSSILLDAGADENLAGGAFAAVIKLALFDSQRRRTGLHFKGFIVAWCEGDLGRDA